MKDLPQPVNRKAISAWDPKRGPCCTVRNFRIDLEGYPCSEWNKSAVRVFATEYLKRYLGGKHMKDSVVEAWLTCVTAIRTQYRQEEEDESNVNACKVQHRQRQRKHEVCYWQHIFFYIAGLLQLYSRRLQTAHQYTEIKTQATQVVESLGLDGMSSDESDHEGHKGEATYYILHKDWCSRQITAWLRMLNSLHLRL